MGWIILHDPDQDRAVFYSSTDERALSHQAFIGVDCYDQAEDFLDWSDENDPRRIENIDQMIDLWMAEAFNDDGRFVGHKSGEGSVHA